MENLKKGDVFFLQCTGERANYRYLNGITEDGTVNLNSVLIGEDQSGTLWQIVEIDDQGFYTIACLGFEGQQYRYLDGNVGEFEVKIVSDKNLAGTKWKIEPDTDGNIKLNNQNQGYYLNGHTLSGDPNHLKVDLIQNAALKGTNWKPVKISDISFGSNTYFNPIVNEGHDPWVIKNNGFYYYCFVRNNIIYVSQTNRLQDIGRVEPCEVFNPGNTADLANIWAPELHIINNIWYISFASGEGNPGTGYNNQRIRIISSVNPTSAFSNSFMTLETNAFAIDGTFLERENRLFLIWSQKVPDGNQQNWKQALYISEIALTPTTVAFIGGKVKISEPTEDWEQTDATSPFPTGVNEGPQVLVSPTDSSKIHIIYSADGSWTNNYCLGRLTYTGGNSVNDLLNPNCWSKHPEPVFSSGQGKTGPFGPGHCSFVRDENEDWIVYHCARYNNAGWTRWVHTQKFGWNGDTPDFGEPIPRLVFLSK